LFNFNVLHRKEKIMKMARFVPFLMFFALLLMFSGSVMAQGFCLTTSFCNDLYFEITAGSGVHSIHGYEYGCGYKDRGFAGSLRVSGTKAYISINGAFGPSCTGPGAHGCALSAEAIIDLTTLSGSYVYNYFGDGSTVSGSDTYTLSVCPPQATSEAIENLVLEKKPDSAQK
jgi:hypothetical protein